MIVRTRIRRLLLSTQAQPIGPIMQNMTKSRSGRKPVIFMTEADYDVIANLALHMEVRDPKLSALILSEIDRARIVKVLPQDVVRLGSEVTFADDTANETRTVRLALPGGADIASGVISVLTPVGIGLIGMKVGAQINWPCPDGRPRILKILQIGAAA